jgi:hypothetical protein
VEGSDARGQMLNQEEELRKRLQGRLAGVEEELAATQEVRAPAPCQARPLACPMSGLSTGMPHVPCPMSGPATGMPHVRPVHWHDVARPPRASDVSVRQPTPHAQRCTRSRLPRTCSSCSCQQGCHSRRPGVRSEARSVAASALRRTS